MDTERIPVVMVFAGNDPSGGAGIQADIETIASMGALAAPIITALTVQDTHNVDSFEAVTADLLIRQARCVLDDMPVACFKIGMLGSVENIIAIHGILADYPQIPVVLDPVLRAEGGHAFGNTGLIDMLHRWLLPQVSLLTPNSEEARALVPGAATLEECALALLEAGCANVLITGTHEATATVDNTLYADGRRMETFSWQRLPHRYHGSGCTLASAIAGLLAAGLDPFHAVQEAQEFTWETLRNAYPLGQGQYHPNRLFWARGED